jgi:predicted enzyme related to lactoylglutathione lyase
MANNAIGWFELYVQDMPRARAFYQHVFGVKLEPIGSPDLEMLAFPYAEGGAGSSGALVKAPGIESGPGGTLVYFTCDDCATEEARVAAAGGRVERPKFPIGEYGYITLAFDTEGNMFGLHSLK